MDLPKGCGRRLVVEWARAHDAELRENWSRARRNEPLQSIDVSTITLMRGTPLLTEAQPLEGHAVHVRFADGTTADVDLSYLLDYGHPGRSFRPAAAEASIQHEHRTFPVVPQPGVEPGFTA